MSACRTWTHAPVHMWWIRGRLLWLYLLIYTEHCSAADWWRLKRIEDLLGQCQRRRLLFLVLSTFHQVCWSIQMHTGDIPANGALKEDQVSMILLEKKLTSDLLCQSTRCRGRSKFSNEVEEILGQPTVVEKNQNASWITWGLGLYVNMYVTTHAESSSVPRTSSRHCWSLHSNNSTTDCCSPVAHLKVCPSWSLVSLPAWPTSSMNYLNPPQASSTYMCCITTASPMQPHPEQHCAVRKHQYQSTLPKWHQWTDTGDNRQVLGSRMGRRY